MSYARRAPFIVIEGLDRSGKTTQITTLHNSLKNAGINTKLMKFPDRTTAIGQMIDSYLKSNSDLDDRAIHLLFSANRWELASKITELVTSGTPVLCDRYAFSGIAFSASKPANIPFEWLRAPDVGLPSPDLTIFLDISPEKAKQRGGYGAERYEKEEIQAKVRAVFHQLGSEMKESHRRWVVLDAGREVEVVARDVWGLVEPLINMGIDNPIEMLWTDK